MQNYILNASLFFVFSLFFSYEVYHTYAKYKEKDTIVSTKLEDRRSQKIRFPVLSICPGFRPSVWEQRNDSNEFTEAAPSFFDSFQGG